MKKAGLCCVLCAALLVGCGGAVSGAGSANSGASSATAPAGSQPETEIETEETAAAGILSDFTAEDLDGNAVDAGIFADHTLTMVNVWATYCGPCIREMPDLGQLAEEYADRGFAVVGIASDVIGRDGTPDQSSMDAAKKIVEQTKAAYPHLVPSESLNTALLAQVSVVPTTVFVDQNGAQVGEIYLGSKSKADWAAVIDALLAKVG